MDIKTLTRLDIFNLHDVISRTNHRKTKQSILDSLLKKWNFDSNNLSAAKVISQTLRLNYYNNFAVHYKLLSRNNRRKEDFQKANGPWLEGSLTFDFTKMTLQDGSTETSENSKGGRPKLAYEDSSVRSRIRKITDLSGSMATEECYDLTKRKLSDEGNLSGLKIFNKIIDKENADELMQNIQKHADISRMSPLSALRLLTDLQLTKFAYHTLRMTSMEHGYDLYPPYRQVLAEKEKTYPTKYEVISVQCTVKLQDLLNHTVERIFDLMDLHFHDDSYTRLVLICKYGFDGTNIKTYKQDLHEDEGAMTAIFCSCMVPLQLIDKKTNTVYWRNRRPSSTRFCRPINMYNLAETTALSQNEEKKLKEEIVKLKDLRINGCNVGFEMMLTMIDGKVCAALNQTSSQKCFVCNETISKLNDIERLINITVNESSLNYGFSILHAKIRFMELVLHISQRLILEEPKWRIPAEHKEKCQEQQKKIQSALREKLGILVDAVLQGSGSTNDGNTARRFFEGHEIVSDVTGFDKDLLRRFHVILMVISCGHSINTEEFKTYGEETARKYAEFYNFYYMPPSVHVILLHGWRIMDKLILPIGWFSEEAQESNNKNVKRFREDHAQKCSREMTNKDTYERLFLHSDPLVSSLRDLPKSKRSELTEEMKKLLLIDDSEDDSDLEFGDFEN